MLPTFNHPTKVCGSIEMKLILKSGKPIIVGTSNSSDNFGPWVGLEMDSSSKPLRISQTVIPSYRVGVEMQKF